MTFSNKEINILSGMLKAHGYPPPKWFLEGVTKGDGILSNWKSFSTPYEDLPIMLNVFNNDIDKVIISWRLKIGR